MFTLFRFNDPLWHRRFSQNTEPTRATSLTFKKAVTTSTATNGQELFSN